MSRIAVQTTRRLKELFAGGSGLRAAIGEIALEAGIEIPTDCSLQVMECNISADVSERTGIGQSATLLLYCERIENRLREKFRRFSGTLHMVAEVRLSEDQSASPSAC